MGQAKTKVECPLCGGRSDTDDACDSPSPAATPEKERAGTGQFDAARPLLAPLLAVDDRGDRGGHPSTASLPAYAGTGPLTSVAEEPGTADGDDEGGTAAAVENHTTSLRHQLVVLRGNRHHPPGHRVRSVLQNRA